MKWINQGLAAVVIACGLAMEPAMAGDQPSAPPVSAGEGGADATGYDRLIEQLGDARYAIRQRAARELLRHGAASKTALVEALDHHDAEIRFAAQRLLISVLEADFQRRVTAFAADTHGEQTHDLPGWDMFREMTGDSIASRKFFLSMLRTEPVLMEAVDQDPEYTAEAVRARAATLLGQIRQPNPSGKTAVTKSDAALGSVAAILLLTCSPDIKLDSRTGMWLAQLPSQSFFDAALRTDAHEGAVRKLTGGWIRHNGTDYPSQVLWLSMRHDLREGLEPARQLMQSPGANVYVRQLAILAVGKLGNREQIDWLTPLLADETRCSFNSNQKFSCEIRDVALAVSIHLSGQQPKDYGFAHVRPNPQTIFQTNTLGFDNDDKRSAAFAKWESWQAQTADIKKRVQARLNEDR